MQRSFNHRAVISGLAFPALALAVLASAAAAPLAESDRQEALAYLERTRAGVVDAVKGLSDAQTAFKPAPDRWSVTEVLEHIALTETMLYDFVSGKVMEAPAPKPDRDFKAADLMVISAIGGRAQKVKAPEPVVPSGRWPHRESLELFLAARARTVEFLKSTPGLRDHAVDSPLGQPLDAYQWVLYISAHSERHTRQILEVKSDVAFPKQ